ncbi:MAG TPA: type IV pilus assembly protein PilM [Mycobacteriales bacterium]|nr:type IV pilus assembly protein PilM [Mycobacteriales bacterium]
MGLDIGTSAVRAAELSLGKNGAKLERFGQVALPPGAVRDGEVVDVATVSEAIKHLWSTTKFSSKKVVLGVANQKVVVRQVDLPWLPESELRQSLAFQVQDFVPMPIEQAILDFHPVEEFTLEGRRMLRVLLVAAARDMVFSALDAVKKAGLVAAQVDLTPFAVLRSLAWDGVSVVPSHSEAEALVDVGSRVTNIVVHQNGVPRFVRVLLMGGDNVTEAVAERMGVPFDQAEGVKQQTPLGPTPGIPSSDHPAARVIETAGHSFVEEIRGSLDYYLAQPASVPLRRVVVSGGGARLGGLVQRLALATRLPVEPAAPLSSVSVGKTGLTPEQLSFVEPLVAVPVGLAMGVAS